VPDFRWPPDGWLDGSVTHRRHRHRYYQSTSADRSDTADTAVRPTVLLLHEFPGITASLGDFARLLADEFRVVVPSIVGRDGSPSQLRSGLSLCIRREVNFFATARPSPALPWLRDLVDLVVSPDGRRFGVIGMCMTGGFALALAVDPLVSAAVAAQPALPLTRVHPKVPLPGEAKRAEALGIDDQTCTRLALRTNSPADASLRVRGYRFRDDWQSPAQRMVALADLLGAGAQVLPDLDDPHADRHSTLTTSDHSPTARADVVRFLHERLDRPGLR
jgi:dienelactone hydrolase